MFKHIFLITYFLLLSCGSGSFVCAQNVELDTRPVLNETIREGEFILLSYSLPYDGVVEIKVYNEEGRRVWRNQYNQRKGEHIIRLKTEKMERGEYRYELYYKGHLVESTFVR